MAAWRECGAPGLFIFRNFGKLAKAVARSRMKMEILNGPFRNREVGKSACSIKLCPFSSSEEGTFFCRRRKKKSYPNFYFILPKFDRAAPKSLNETRNGLNGPFSPMENEIPDGLNGAHLARRDFHLARYSK